MMTALRTIALLWAALVLSQPALGWHEAGHKLVAQIAWTQLSSDTQNKITALLEKHPFLSKPDLLDVSIFPDLIKNPKKFPTFPRNQVHKEWHFIDLPYNPDGAPVTNPPSVNAVSVINRKSRDLKNGTGTEARRAVDLSWLVHLVGDLHQPLHCVTLFSADHPRPEGDRGGNEITIRVGDRHDNIHNHWDGLHDADGANIAATAAAIQAANPRSSFTDKLSDSTVRNWARDSRQLAIDEIYTKITEGEALPDGYDVHAKDVASRQIALAGYRLADKLKAIFGP